MLAQIPVNAVIAVSVSSGPSTAGGYGLPARSETPVLVVLTVVISLPPYRYKDYRSDAPGHDRSQL